MPNPRSCAVRICILAILLGYLAFALPLTSHADVVKPALIEISVYRDGSVVLDVRASLEALLTGINADYKNTQDAPTAAQYDELRVLPANLLEQEFERFHNDLTKKTRLSVDGQTIDLQVKSVRVPEPGYTKVPRISQIELSGNIPSSATSLNWYYPRGFGDNAVRVRQVDEANELWHWSDWQWLKNDQASTPFSLNEVFAKQTSGQIFFNYAVLGFEHIVPKGLDHILFILGLFLFSRRIRPLLWQVTMFTLAHTITLGLASSGFIELPPRIVEPLIALSIAWIAFENIWARSLHSYRLALVFGFGLLHGLGFAGVLTEFGMSRDSFLWSLLGFNVGVEIAQLTIILCCGLLVALLIKNENRFRRYLSIPLSLVIGLIGIAWTFERIVL